MTKIIIWYLDSEGNTRLCMKEKPIGYEVPTLLYEFSQYPGVKTILEAYTVSQIHEIHEHTWTEGFYVTTKNVEEKEEE